MRLKGQWRQKMLPGTDAPVTAMTLPSAKSRWVSGSQHVNLHSDEETVPTVQIHISGSHFISLCSLNLSLAPQVQLYSAANVHFKYTKYRKYTSNSQMMHVSTQENTYVCSFLLSNITASENAVLIFLRLKNKLWNRESLSKTTKIAKRGSLIRLFLLICWWGVPCSPNDRKSMCI